MTPQDTPHNHSVSGWLAGMKEGDQQAIQRLWERYFGKLMEYAKGQLRGASVRARDEEDIALSAFGVFCQRAQMNGFPKLHDREDLWQVLVMLTRRKAIGLRRYEGRAIRGGGQVRSFSELEWSEGELKDFSELIARDPDPAFVAQVAEVHDRLLGSLDETERRVAEMGFQRYTNQEIAEAIGKSVATVERRMVLIRTVMRGLESEG